MGKARTSGAGGASILVDARGIAQSGIGRYLRAVLARVLDDPRFSRVTLLGRPEEIAASLPTRTVATVRVVAFPHPFYSVAAQAHWAALAVAGRLAHDVAFFPHYDVPVPASLRRSVVTVHDLTQFHLRDIFPWWKVAAGGVVLDRALRRASRVVAVSHAAGADLLLRHPGVAPRLHVIPQGVDARWSEPGNAASVEALRPYLLCVGNRRPHKNWVAAVEVLARLRPRFPALRLVLAGRGEEDRDLVAARAAARGVADAVVEVRDAPDERLAALYAGAECLLFPSLHEGFGLPALEAMAAGLPVVCSDRASLPEVVGDAGVVAGPHDHDALAGAVRRLLEEPAFRATLVERGRRRAAEFRWERTAARTADLLWEVAAPAHAPAGRSRRLHEERHAPLRD